MSFIECLVVTSMAHHCHQESGCTKALRVLEPQFLPRASLLTTTSSSLLLHALTTLNSFPFQNHDVSVTPSTMLFPQPPILCSYLLCLLSYRLLSLDSTFSKKSSQICMQPNFIHYSSNNIINSVYLFCISHKTVNYGKTNTMFILLTVLIPCKFSIILC